MGTERGIIARANSAKTQKNKPGGVILSNRLVSMFKREFQTPSFKLSSPRQDTLYILDTLIYCLYLLDTLIYCLYNKDYIVYLSLLSPTYTTYYFRKG